MIRRLFRSGPIVRLSLGLVSLLICLLLILDLSIGLVPDRYDDAVRIRQRICESLAIQVTALLQSGEGGALRKTLADVLERDKELLSVATRRADGQLLAVAGDHNTHWSLPDNAPSSVTQVRVPLMSDGLPWGDVEVAFRPVSPQSAVDWLSDPMVRALALVSVIGFAVVYLYLRRALQYLDPGSVVPQRVRAAFDTLSEGVLVLDSEARVVLANRAFQGLHPEAAKDLTGRPATKIGWLMAGLDSEPERLPWNEVARSGRAVREEPLEITQEEGKVSRLLLNASPITDVGGRVRGCMLSLSDVSVLHRINDQLLETLQALDESNEQIRQQNEELTKLATRDPLTGCLNRRAFFDKVKIVLETARESGMPVSCIMSDIDHFKGFNDKHGHAVGDQVLQVVSRSLTQGVRNEDLLCRYGGEEFCIVLPGLNLSKGAEVAERLRASIESMAGSSLRTTERLKVTSSFGVSQLEAGSLDEADLINRADQALYEAKRQGRNRVVCEVLQVA